MASDQTSGSTNARLKLRVAEVREEASGIRSFTLVDPAGGSLPPFTAGAHLLVDLENGLQRHYSLCNDPVETHRYVIAVLREPNGRGGSSFMHDKVREGVELTVSEPRNNFALVDGAKSYLMIAGGIGITPILAMCRALNRRGADYRLHYCSRTVETTAFRAELGGEPFAPRVGFHHDGGDPAKGIDLRALLETAPPGTHLYCCGPNGLMKAVEQAAAHWPTGTVHFEFFSGTGEPAQPHPGDQPFELVAAKSGKVMQVPANRTILSVLEENGIHVDSVCQEGICATCLTGVIEGVPDHRDLVLDAQEKAQNKLIAVCCSRSKTSRLVLDL